MLFVISSSTENYEGETDNLFAADWIKLISVCARAVPQHKKTNDDWSVIFDAHSRKYGGGGGGDFYLCRVWVRLFPAENEPLAYLERWREKKMDKFHVAVK